MKQYVSEVERAQNTEELEKAETVAITKITKQVGLFRNFYSSVLVEYV